MSCYSRRNTIPSLTPSLVTQPQAFIARTPVWGVVLPTLNGNYLHIVELDPWHGVEPFIRIVLEDPTSRLGTNAVVRYLLKPVSSTVAGTAVIQLAFEDPYQPGAIRVVFEDHEQDAFLTEAIQKPNRLRHSATLITYYTSLNVPPLRSLEGFVGQRVLVIEQKLDKRKVALLLVIQLLLSSPLGVIVGLFAHRYDIGIAVTAGIIALTAFLQGLAVWFHG